MRETKAVEEVRDWRRKVYEETKDLTAAGQAAREKELLRKCREAGIEFIEILPEPKPAASS